MAFPIPYADREKIICLRKEGTPYGQIAKLVGCSARTTKRIWYQFQTNGEKALITNYHRSGCSSPYQGTIEEKIKGVRDGQQGAPYVRSVLLERYPDLGIPHERTIQRWWKACGGNRPKGRPRSKANWTSEPNHTWQIDGKEYIQLSNGDLLSWMNIADEATSSDLYTRLFPPQAGISHSIGGCLPEH